MLLNHAAVAVFLRSVQMLHPLRRLLGMERPMSRLSEKMPGVLCFIVSGMGRVTSRESHLYGRMDDRHMGAVA